MASETTAQDAVPSAEDVRALEALQRMQWIAPGLCQSILLALTAARAEEREACAALMSSVWWNHSSAESRAAAIRARGNDSGVADPARGDAAGEQAQPPQHRDAAGKPADSSGARCTLCGASRIDEVAGTYGACGNLECRDPMHDYRKEHAPLVPAPVAAAAAMMPGARLVAEAEALFAKYEPITTVAELRAEVARLTEQLEGAETSHDDEEAAHLDTLAQLKRTQAEVARKDAALRRIRELSADVEDKSIDLIARAALAPAAPSAEGSGM